jgi:hypothetical protein
MSTGEANAATGRAATMSVTAKNRRRIEDEDDRWNMGRFS